MLSERITSVSDEAASPLVVPLRFTAFPQPVSVKLVNEGGAVHSKEKVITFQPSAIFGALWVISARPLKPLISVCVFAELPPPTENVPSGADTLRPPKSCATFMLLMASVYSLVELGETVVGPVSVTTGA